MTETIETSRNANVDVKLNAGLFGSFAYLVDNVFVEFVRQIETLAFERLGELMQVYEAAAVRVGQQKRLELLVKIVK